ncbi:magnesium and cobalt efflux protein CorC [bacterium BMS3Bbin04]|nr:magnesium and cobalt efflux protein CorC [bacterium BMS3Bbin04]
MDSQLYGTEIVVFIALLVLSAFFSGSETAFFSLSKAQIRDMRERTDLGARRVTRLLDRPRDLLVAILIGNTVVNTSAASIAALVVTKAAMAAGMDPRWALLAQILIVTFLLIVLVEISPKVFALKNNERWAMTLSGPVQLAGLIMWPVTKLFVALVDLLARLFGVEATRILFNEEELRTLAEVSEEHGVLEEDEREMIHSIFEFGETEAGEIMVPRIDMVAVQKDEKVEQLIRTIREKGHSRIPVYDKDVDHIVGILYAKDLIGTDRNGHAGKAVSEVMRDAYFVPESKRIATLLREFQKNKIHMAIVVDEYGGTEGLVTMEDVMEEIVGEIQDEFDTEEELLHRLDDGDILVLAKMEVSDFNHEINEDVVPKGEDFDTLGGFIFQLAGDVPTPGQEFHHSGWSFKVNAVDGNRILSLRVHPPADTQVEGQDV